MAVNLASKYADKVVERFRKEAITQVAVNEDFEWSGVQTVTLLSVTNPSMNDYSRTGTARYGTPGELQDTKQDLTLANDRSFTFTIDKGNYREQNMLKKSGKMLRQVIEEVVVPEVDKYRLAAMASAAVTASNTTGTAGAITASNAYTKFLAASEALNDALVPMKNRVAFMSSSYYTFLKLDSNFIKASDMGQDMLAKGVVGMVDGCKIVLTPSSYFPANTNLIMTHPSVTVAPELLKEYKVHQDPPGINGWLIEGRLIYDAFVITDKVDGICIHKTA